MTRTPRLRRPATVTAAVSAAALLGALLPVTFAPAAVAANGCLTEVETGAGPIPFLQPGGRCDDQVPPEATLESITPAPNNGGYVATDSLTFTFSGAHLDEDQDVIGFECQFYSTAAEPTSWTSCTSPVTYDDLADTTSVPYTFKVRAFDAADRQIDATDDPSTNPLIPGSPADTDLPDVQESAEVAVVKVDTRAPQTYIFNTPYDAETPELPMLTTDSPTFRLAASEGNVSYTCLIEEEVFPCATEFTVPADIEKPKNKKWSESSSRKAFGGSYIETTRFNARFSVRGTDVREVRLICTTRPDVGILKYKVPGGSWQKAKIKSKTVERQAVVILRNQSSKSFTGKLKFRTYSRNKPVAVDAIMMR